MFHSDPNWFLCRMSKTDRKWTTLGLIWDWYLFIHFEHAERMSFVCWQPYLIQTKHFLNLFNEIELHIIETDCGLQVYTQSTFQFWNYNGNSQCLAFNRSYWKGFKITWQIWGYSLIKLEAKGYVYMSSVFRNPLPTKKICSWSFAKFWIAKTSLVSTSNTQFSDFVMFSTAFLNRRVLYCVAIVNWGKIGPEQWISSSLYFIIFVL